MCPSAPRVCSEPGGQKPVLSLSLDLIGASLVQAMAVEAPDQIQIQNIVCTTAATSIRSEYVNAVQIRFDELRRDVQVSAR